MVGSIAPRPRHDLVLIRVASHTFSTLSRLSLLSTHSAAVLGAPPVSLLSLIFRLLSLPGWPALSALVTIPGVAPLSGASYLSVYSALSRICAGGLSLVGAVKHGGSRLLRLYPASPDWDVGVFHVAQVPPEQNSPSLLCPIRHLLVRCPMAKASLVLGTSRPYLSGLDSLVTLPVFSSDICSCLGCPLSFIHDAPSLVHS